MSRLIFSILVIACIFLFSCKQPPEIVPPKYQPKYLHEGYTLSLEEAGLSHTALGKDWIAASNEALLSQTTIKAPYEEEFYVLANQASAYSYKIEGLKGQKIKVSLDQTGGDSTLLFLDAFRTDSLANHRLIASADKEELVLAFEVVEDGSFIIRFQTELLRKGQFKIKIIKVPSLEFPVAGGKTHDIGSLFGVPRDAGKRRHEGIDIFARRHTPIIAPTDGNINWAGERKGSLGGKVIWMRDTARNQTLYFAHLQDVFVNKGDKAVKGDTIGTVGNSGNAITTAPHLHFGMYHEDGAVNPYHHVVSTRTRTSRILANKEYLGQELKVKRNTKLRKLNSDENSTIQLDKNQLIQIKGVYANSYRVALPNGQEGSIFYDDVSPINGSIRKLKRSEFQLMDSPNDQGINLLTIKDGEVEVLASSDQEYLYVKTFGGLKGWIHI